MKNITLAIRGLWSIIAALKEADKGVSEKFSDQWWLELRKRLEIRLVRIYQRADKGLLKHFESDNAFLRGMMILLKSDKMYEIFAATTPKEKFVAINQLFSKNCQGSWEDYNERRKERD